MERFLVDLRVWCWQYLDNPRGYPGAHFTADSRACEALLEALNVIEAEGVGARRTICLRPLRPKDEAKISGGLRYRCFQKLRLLLAAGSPQLRQMHIRAEDEVLVVEIVKEHLSRLRGAIDDVRRGEGDYAIAPDGPEIRKRDGAECDRRSLQLWFWPCFGHSAPV